ncbi:hypothetical protein EC968_004417 [Mortierella alpina]|nr:hypothetical protein EC968_004417 [Mortierella alpina]
MVYATRSRTLNKSRPTASSDRPMGEQKQTPKKKRQPAKHATRKTPVTQTKAPAKSTKKAQKSTAEGDGSNTAKATATPAGGVEMEIDTIDPHQHHHLDGKDHHVVEQDGRDHHHIWYKDFAENKRVVRDEDRADSPHRTSDAHQTPVPGAQPRRSRRPSNASLAHPPFAATPTAEPLVIQVDHSHRKHPHDGKDHHIIEADGRDHHHIRYGEMSTGQDTVAHKAPKLHDNFSAGSASHGSVSISSQHQMSFNTAATKMTTSNTTTTVQSSHSEASQLDQQHHPRLHTREEGAVRLLAQKSELDRAKARQAIQSLDMDVVQLQKLLHEKETMLRDAEKRAKEGKQLMTIKTSTLTVEIRELQQLVQNLAANLQAKEQALQESHRAIDNVKKHDQKEMSEVQKQSLGVQRRLEQVNKQRELLAAQVKEATHALREREHELKTAHSTVKGLEKAKENSTREARRLSNELTLIKKSVSEKQSELQQCHSKIKSLEGEHHKVQTLGTQLHAMRAQLSERETHLKDLEKENRSLTKDHDKAAKLTKEVKVLREDIHEAENLLRGAQKAVDDLSAYKDRAAALQVEVHDLHDQVNILEKHDTDLENALMAHEHCASEAQILQGQVNELQARLNEKQSEIRELQSANVDLYTQDESMIALMETELRMLSDQLAAKDTASKQLKEKADKETSKFQATASRLKSEAAELRKQLKDRTLELKNAGSDMGQVQQQNSTLAREIQKLERLISTKDRHAAEMDDYMAKLKEQAGRTAHLEGEIKQLQKESKLSKKVADHAIKDLAAASSFSNKLTTEVQTLKDRLTKKEGELQQADRTVKDLEKQASEMQSLLSKMSALEKTSQDHQKHAERADETSKNLRAEIKHMQTKLKGLRDQLEEKEATLHQAEDRSKKDHDEGVLRIEELRGLVAALREQLRDAEKEAKTAVKAKEEQILALKRQLGSLQQHEEGWASKTAELNKEIEKETALLRQKEKAIQELQRKMTEQTHEIGRLNTVVARTRAELTEDRQRHVSEASQTAQIESELKSQLSDLRQAKQNLEKKAQADEHQHEVHEHELEKQIQGLLAWQQKATQEWQAAVAKLENERQHQAKDLSQYEHDLLQLKAQLQQANDWRRKANEHTEKLSAMVAKLEKQQKLLKDVVVQHDKSEARTGERLLSLQGQIQSLVSAKATLQREIDEKEESISEMEDRLKQTMANAQAKTAQSNKDLAAKDQVIQTLNARMNENAASDKQALEALQSKLSKAQTALKAQQDHARELEAKESRWRQSEAAYRGQLQTLSQGQDTLQHQVYELKQAKDREHLGLQQIQAEKTKNDQVIAQLRTQTAHLQEELTTMETRMKTEMRSTQELRDHIAHLRTSIRSDSEAELKEVAALERELKHREEVVKETMMTQQVSRSRMDSGAFLEQQQQQQQTQSAASSTTTTAH